MNANDGNNKGFLDGLFWGVVLGILAGFMYAPDKGEKTRKKVKKEYEKWRDEADVQVQRLRQLRDDRLPEVKEKIREHSDQVRDHARKFADKAKEEVATARTAMEEKIAEKQKVL